MKQKLLIFLALIFLMVVLVGLNAVSYTQKEKMPDNEFSPNRSTYNNGATGTSAFYKLMAETGRNVSRWQEPPSALFSNGSNKPNTFVIIGPMRREFDQQDTELLLRWVADGGKLVIIDREPPKELITTTANWNISAVPEAEDLPFFDTDPSDQKQMTDKTVAAKPLQPTVYTAKVNAVQPSRFASSFSFERFADVTGDRRISTTPANTAPTPADAPAPEDKSSAVESEAEEEEIIETPALTAPVVHLANDKKILLIDFPFGSGQIVFLTDPFIVSNGGISMVDNAQIGINMAASREGLIVFDEYHQGYGADENRFLAFFAGTPVVAIFVQIAVLIGLLFYSQSRRFARPLPENEPNRLSKLEYVSAMAELQQRTKAFDLAVENIYTDFRRRVSRALGVANFETSRKELARRISERINGDEFEIYNLMRKCEDIMHGEQTNKKEVLKLTSQLRKVEEQLGLQRGKKVKK